MISELIEKKESSGGFDEDTYYLLMDEETGELFVKHSWNYLIRGRGIDDGTKTIPLNEFEKEHGRIYRKALEMSKKEPFTREK